MQAEAMNIWSENTVNTPDIHYTHTHNFLKTQCIRNSQACLGVQSDTE